MSPNAAALNVKLVLVNNIYYFASFAQHVFIILQWL